MVALACIGIIGVAGWSAYFDLRQTIGAAGERNARAADLLAIQISNTVQNASLQIEVQMEELAKGWIDDPIRFSRRHAPMLTALADSSDAIDAVVAAGLEGVVLWSTTTRIVGVDISDREYFRDAMSAPPGTMVLGDPIISRGTGRYLTPLAWPVHDADGVRKGVLAASLDVGFFGSFVETLALEPGMTVEVATNKGERVLVASLSEEVRAPRRSTSEDAIFEAMMSAAGLGGGAGVLAAGAQAPNLDYRISVTQDIAPAISDWKLRAIVTTAFAISLAAILAVSAVSVRNRQFALVTAMIRARNDERAATRARAEFEAIFESVGDSVVIYDADGEFSRASRAALNQLGAADAESAVERLLEIFPEIEEDQGSPRRDLAAREAVGPDGVVREFSCAVSRVETGARLTLFCILRDLTQERRLERARARFVASVNHELRTPLTSLKGSLDMFARHFAAGLDADAATLIKLSQRNAERLLNLVNDVLTVQAIDADGLSLSVAPVKADEAVQDAVDSLQGYADGFGVRLILVTDGSHPTILVDRDRLLQVFANLISNAVKFSPRNGEVRVSMAVEAGSVVYEVADDGDGIPWDLRARLFERFAPGRDRGGIAGAQGTGLGLAISHELVTRLGGDIGYETRAVGEIAPGEASGTVFRIRFAVHGGDDRAGEGRQGAPREEV
ncbi:ATP-binding protein [uncultured Albimonas sp.]|uniref:ATP-binding protein n=1 Tax=uncultured Albimonas sp. TaxID=1331701 RepID=UPI0030EE1745|tara:strand:+ start:9615 stop:11642 length:2028 start_codon:yes stop_codon:yes gene_type:complete